MKKIGFILMILLLLMLTGCNSKEDTPTVMNGSYIMEHDDETVLTPSVTISDDTFTFFYDPLSSYMPIGSYKIEEDVLTLTTDDKKYHYVFRIDGDSLIFQKDESSTVRLIDKRIGPQVEDQAVFNYVEEKK